MPSSTCAMTDDAEMSSETGSFARLFLHEVSRLKFIKLYQGFWQSGAANNISIKKITVPYSSILGEWANAFRIRFVKIVLQRTYRCG